MIRILLPALLLTSSAAAADLAPAFEKEIRPLLKAYCFECHGDTLKHKGGLDLRLRRLLVQGGDSGPAINPGQSKDSLLLARVASGEMPPGKKKLSPAEVSVLRRWIDAGARTAAAEPQKIAGGFFITPEDHAFWAFQPVRRSPPPAIRNPQAAAHNPIDVFLDAKRQAGGVAASGEADRRTLVRRAYLGLTGLPPSPEEAEAFLADQRPDAYELLVERLLSSPHYGERWGRHWLDVAGYADSDGYTSEDRVRPHAWRYRDYVIRSLNADKPFDQFIREQLAGDEMVKPPYKDLRPEDVEKLTATGFLRMAPDGSGSPGIDEKLARNQVLADTIKIVTTSLMGLSVACAQCHNHRYDPIPQTDYYRLRALFEPAYDWTNWRTPPARLVSLYTDADRGKAKQIEADAARIDAERLKKQEEFIERTVQKELAKLPENMRETVRAARTTKEAKRSAEQKKLLKEYPSVNVSEGSLYLYDSKAAAELKAIAAKAAALRGTKPPEEFIHALTEIPGKAPPTYLFSRGDHDQPREQLQPGGLVILDETAALRVSGDPSRATSGRRLALADWLTGGKHPLTARVLVNRVWMHHFGKGIVATPGDFGALGDRPTHPELLDWLADDFAAHGWSLKRLHRLIVTSAAYRQTSRRDPVKDRIDPDNRLLSRMSVRRLEAETLRDSILAVSGNLNRKPFGKPVPVTTDDAGQVVIGFDNKDTAGYIIRQDKLAEREELRRSVYVQVRRTQPLTVTEPFDAPLVEPNCESRSASTIAPQALMLMNNAFVIAQAEVFARRIGAEAGDDPAARIRRAWKLAYSRDPQKHEADSALQFLREQESVFAKRPKTDAKLKALTSLCHALLSSSEFLYVD